MQVITVAILRRGSAANHIFVRGGGVSCPEISKDEQEWLGRFQLVRRGSAANSDLHQLWKITLPKIVKEDSGVDGADL